MTEVINLDKLLAKFGQLPFTIQIRAFQKAMKLSTLKIQGSARNKAPSNNGALAQSINVQTIPILNGMRGKIYTRLSYAGFVELGTGPKGEANHGGISPHVFPSYTSVPWYIHESQIDGAVAEKYHFSKFTTDDGNIFYKSYGQAAQPFLYPAMKEEQKNVRKIFATEIMNAISEVASK